MNALEARKKFGGMLDEVAQEGRHILILRLNKPLAVLVPYKDYQERLDPAAREKRLLSVFNRMDAWRESHREKLKGLDAVKMIRAVRDSRGPASAGGTASSSGNKI